jgi:[ribosomal protein S18]-alanine N-acetyltransferase
LTLEVRKSNKGAQALYEKFGFKKSHIRKDYYITEDAVVYVKEVRK